MAARKLEILMVMALCASSLLCGCAAGPDFVRPEAPSVKQYTQGSQPEETISANGGAQRFDQGAKLAADWWSLFKSPELDAVIKEAIANNPTLQAAEASLRESQYNLKAGYGVFYPQLDANASAERQLFSPAKLGQTAAGSIFNLFTLGAVVGYTLDVFGGARRQVESLRAQEDYQRDTMLAAYIALTGNVINTVIARAAYITQIDATVNIITLEREQVRVANVQAMAGTVPYSNVLALQSQLAAIEATLPQLKQKLSQTEDLLATLMGRLPAEWTSPQVRLVDLTLPRDLPLSLPSELVRQRPDILAAEAQLHSANAEIGVATAALLPSFTLNGTYGVNSTSTDDLLKKSSSFWSLGPDVDVPLFHGGTLMFQRKAAVEAYRQSLANYRQTVLTAFAQVADTLRALEHDAETLRAQSQALDTAAEALRLININYQAGTVNYLDVLNANNQFYQTKIAYLQATAQRFQDTVALFVALGGGWRDAKEGDILGGQPAASPASAADTASMDAVPSRAKRQLPVQ